MILNTNNKIIKSCQKKWNIQQIDEINYFFILFIKFINI